jgi:hypothetical protein
MQGRKYCTLDCAEGARHLGNHVFSRAPGESSPDSTSKKRSEGRNKIYVDRENGIREQRHCLEWEFNC